MKEKAKKASHSMRDNILYILSDAWRRDKILILYLALEIVCGVATPFFGIYLPKLVVDMITGQGSPGQMITTMGGFTLAMAGVAMLNGFFSSGKYMRYNDMRMWYMYKLFDKTLTCDYVNMESPEGQTRYQKARAGTHNGDQSGINLMMQRLVSLIVACLCFVLYSSILSVLNPIIVLLLICTALINYAGLRYAVKYKESNTKAMAKADKRMGYIERTTGNFASGKDIRVYGMKPLFVRLRDEVLGEKLVVERKNLNRNYLSYSIGALTNLIRDGFAYVYLIYQALAGNITISEFLLYFGAISGFAGWVSRIINDYVNMSWASTELNHMREFLEQSDSPDPNPSEKLPFGTISIEFRKVCFSYDRDSGMILDNFSLTIKPGEKVALVGVNGAGKTTLVKLLCGFYKPDSGKILINGTDISMLKKEDLFSLFSAVFQDIMILPLSIAENVALCSSEQIERGRAEDCLEWAGLMGYITCLPEGIDSPMLKVFHENGIMLSGGQQQRLLLARALYKDAPMLVLDEPTAALDPIAESEVYERYRYFAENKTSIFISHRLASTRFCDRIIFLDSGRPAEVGTHDELMRLGGLYATMYKVQSRYYKQDAMEGAVGYETV